MAIQTLEKAADSSAQPTRSILQNLTATAYWNYLQENRDRFYDRTNTIGFVKKDIATWTIADFREKIGQLYLASLKEERLLSKVRVDDYAPIVIRGNVPRLRPSLFDLLAHSALGYFTNTEEDIDLPANVFVIDDPAAFDDAEVFADHSFVTQDSSSLQFFALRLFQRLIRMHLSDARPDALIDVDIERLRFINAFAVVREKDRLYAAALNRLTDRWGSEPAAAQAWYLRASRYVDRAKRYYALGDTAGRYDYAAAKAICDRVIAEKDSSEGREGCKELLETILEKKLDIDVETVNLPGQPFRAMVDWRNVPLFYYRIVRLADRKADIRASRPEGDASWQRLRYWPVLRQVTQRLPVTNDYQSHGSEIKVDALPIGEYALLASTDSSFGFHKDGEDQLAVGFFHVSGISFINHNSDYFVLDREGGKPLADAAVQVWEWDQVQNRYHDTLRKDESYRTDEHGHFRLAEHTSIDPNLALEIRVNGDRLFVSDISYEPFYSEDMHASSEKDRYELDHRYSYVFTDRAIYRPGQTVYFKGIVMTKDFTTRQTRVVPHLQTMVYLDNVSLSKVDSMVVTSNDFGSYHGQFKIPENILPGQFQIRDSGRGGVNFSVEEYKRPAFFVGYEPSPVIYRVGDSVFVTGFAKAYAGNRIDGAEVRYNVNRQVHFFYPCRSCMAIRSIGAVWGGWGPYQDRNAQPLVHGTVKTDKEGRFRIGFVAAADKFFSPEEEPVFEYVVSAEVTDIDGETHSAENFVRAGYVSLALSIDRPSGEHVPADSLKTVIVRASDLSGTTASALTTVTVFSLRSPDRLIRERYWPAPDQFVLSKEAFLRYFPRDEYGVETKKENWERLENVFEGADSAGKPLTIRGKEGKDLAPGWYLIEARSKDKDGRSVRAEKYIELLENGTGRPAQPQYNWPMPDRQAAQPGEKVTVEIGTSADKVYAIRTVDPKEAFGSVPGKPCTYFTLEGGKKQAAFAVTEADRGGFVVADAFVKDNRFFTRQSTVEVPWTNKELDVHLLTYRDKAEPGSLEKWQVSVRRWNSEKAAAEVLATMYDASLDQFEMPHWDILQKFDYPRAVFWTGYGGFNRESTYSRWVYKRYKPPYRKEYDRLTGGDGRLYRMTVSKYTPPRYLALGSESKPHTIQIPDNDADPDGSLGLMRDTLFAEGEKPSATLVQQEVVRKNFRETAFFYPDLQTDSNGNVGFSFTMPEALTTWKGMILAHTRDLAVGFTEQTVLTQKALMVQPNVPRFLREGDRMELSVKVVNLTDSVLTGDVSLALTDPSTGQRADSSFVNSRPDQHFTVAPRQSVAVGFPLNIPFQYNSLLTYRVMAQSGRYSDGEEGRLPVVSNRLLVTESLPLNMRGEETRHFTFDKLLGSGGSETLNHHSLTVEFTANPAWLALQALPYLMEYPYECAEQTFDRFYANALAATVIGASPRLQQVFDQWRTADTTALLSALQKNQELKSILLEETPWVLDGKTEEQQKLNVALLFDLGRMSRESVSTLKQLRGLQSRGGGFAWFKGGTDDRYITQYILTGIGRLQGLKAVTADPMDLTDRMVKAALGYADYELKESWLQHQTSIDLAVQYLYMRSLFPACKVPAYVLPAMNYYRKNVQQSWAKFRPQLQGMTALALYRMGDVKTALKIIASLKQRAIRDEERGMYWEGMDGGDRWFEAPVETEALLIEAFRGITGDTAADRQMKTWLLRQKQVKSWPTTKATADACYALLKGQDWLRADRSVTVRLGNKAIEWPAGSGEVGSGYNKKIFDGPFVNPAMGDITVTVTDRKSGNGDNGGGSPSWGAVYWQYFDVADRIVGPGGEKNPLSLNKKLFIRRQTDRGPVLEPVRDNDTLRIGDRVVVRVELRADRDMEYVHMKDMRAACLEPEDVISEYKWQDGLGYYESTRDASTDFFFGSLPKGTYVFEYSLRAGQTGNFSNGITRIECMYAPEFAYHSEGIRINVAPAR